MKRIAATLILVTALGGCDMDPDLSAPVPPTTTTVLPTTSRPPTVCKWDDDSVGCSSRAPRPRTRPAGVGGTKTAEDGSKVPANFYDQQDLVPVGAEDGDCQEDEPCWDCRTMGNRICGPESEVSGK